MASATFTIRNLTATPLELKVIERYVAPSVEESRIFSNFTRNITSLVSTTPSATLSAEKLAEHAQTFDSQDVSICIEPFTVYKTDIDAAKRSPDDIIRLTFQTKNQRYRIDARATKESTELTPLCPDPKHRFTGIWIDASFLAIYSSANLHCWMKELSDATPLSGLSIPGTHNSATHHRALPSVRCQAVSPRRQLENGIRFFDVRVQPESATDPSHDGLILVHGVFPVSLTGTKYFRALLDEILAFLIRNPSETLILSLKREGPGSATDEHLATILHDHYTAPDPNRWWTSPHIPSLGQARGKIVLLRRFALAPHLTDPPPDSSSSSSSSTSSSPPSRTPWGGLDAQCWAYNTPADIHGSVHVQDFCEVLTPSLIPTKISHACAHFERAGQDVCPIPGLTTDSAHPVPAGPLYLNFLSASNFWNRECWPRRIAKVLNPRVVEFLCREHGVGPPVGVLGSAASGDGASGSGEREEEGGTKRQESGDGALGVVVCDWVGERGDWDLVRCVVGMNARLELREKMLLAAAAAAAGGGDVADGESKEAGEV